MFLKTSLILLGPIPTKASIVNYFPEEGSIQFTFTPIMTGKIK
jgi:hypothetical protein